MDSFLDFFNHPFFIILGGLSAIVLVLGTAYKIITWVLGITPIILRFGGALQTKKIAIYGSKKARFSLKETLLDSRLFKEKNIIAIDKSDFAKGKTCSIYLVDWKSCGERISEIYDLRKSHQIAVIIFAQPGSIPQDIMSDIANRPNTVIVNFKGRLLNDILTSLVTTSYDG